MLKYLTTKPDKHQRRSSRLAVLKKRFGFFMYMGTGKTLACICALIRIWKKKKEPILVLVICPKAVVYVWTRQIVQHVNDDMINIDAQVMFSNDLRCLETFHGTNHDIKILVTNFECARNNYKRLREFDWKCISLDESHRIKKPAGTTSKNLWRLGLETEYKFILTGTPTGGDELELFSQVRFLDEKIMGYQTWSDFKDTWCRQTGYGGYTTVLKKVKEKAFYKRIAPYCYVVQKHEVRGRKEGTDNYLYFDMTGKAKKHYFEMEKTFYTEYEDMEVFNELAITNMLRLQQLTGGFLDNGEERVKLNQDKMDTLSDWFDDFPKDEKLVISARFTAEIDELEDFFGQYGTTAILDGRTKKSDLGLWQDFQDKNDPQYFIVQEGSGSQGIELFRSAFMLFFSRSHSHFNFDQLKNRLTRRGQKRPVNFFYLVGNKTVDEDIDYVLQDKDRDVNYILRNLRRRYNQNG